MKNQVIEEDIRLSKARELVHFLEQSDEESAIQIIDDITNVRNTDLFDSIGRLTRDLHNAISGVGDGADVSQLTSFEIPDAKERLNYVVKMTEQAADKTLSAIEDILPRCDQLHDRSVRLSAIWNRYASGDMPEEEFHSMSDVIRSFLNKSEADSDKIRIKLKEVLIAQEYQDITSQVIGRVIRLVEDVETSLMKVLRLTGLDVGKTEKPGKRSEDELEGPQIPGHRSSTAVNGQDEVDDLLSSLGF
ncbi:protein phosphatase CheZ [Gammaproteobacteria bacterium AH-315-C21]|nr:protein phosphatase CheZ [Gammaproteobacteria bacterium AH-315-C21]